MAGQIGGFGLGEGEELVLPDLATSPRAVEED
jgi:hypothetical protein